MKIVTLYDRDSGKVGKALDFSVRRNRVRIGGWNAFPLRKPIAFRTSENLQTKGWQVDVLFFSLAVKYAEAKEMRS